jgi:outer membrane receptor protein involved in Fe transport
MKLFAPVVLRGSLLACLILGAARAAAQTTGDLDGAVTDSTNAPLPGVSLEARSPSLQGVRVARSDLKGLFRFPILPPGVYTVSARLPGFKPAEETNLRVGLGETAWLPITMMLSAKAEVEISGEAPVIDTASTRIGASLTGQAVSSLPLGRNFASVANTVGGAGSDAGGLTLYGASGLENQYIIDGLNTTGVRYGNQGKSLNIEFVQDVEVRTGGYEAEFGQVLGANINVVTKSGGNEFHGGVFGYYDSGTLASADQHAADRDAVAQGQFTLPRRYDLGLDLGGYVLKDRLWFFGAYNRVASDQEYSRVESVTYYTPATFTTNLKDGTDTTRTNLFSGKLTYRASPGHSFTLSVFGDPSTSDGRNGEIGPDSAALISVRGGGTDVSARWDGLFGSQFLVQAQYGYHEEKNRQSSGFADQLAIAQLRRGTGVVQFLPGSGPPELDDENYRRNVYKLSGTAFLGAHEVKAGVNFENMNSTRAVRFGGGGEIIQFLARGSGAFQFAQHSFFVRSPPNCIVLSDGTLGDFGFVDPTTCYGWEPVNSFSGNPTARNLSLFAQDSWKVLPNLTVNAGLRYDDQRLLDAAGDARIKLTGQWSPRLGAVWDPIKNGRSKVFASYGRFYQVLPQDLQVLSLGTQTYANIYNLTIDRLDPVADPRVIPLAPTLFDPFFAYIYGGDYVPPDLKGMYQDEFILGAEVEAVKGWSIGVKGIYKSLGRTIEDRCDVYDPRANIQDLVPSTALSTCTLMNVGEGALGQFPDPANPECFSDYPASTQPTPCPTVKARRKFRGLEVDVTHRYAKRFYVLASYLYSRLEGNYDGFVTSRGQTNPGQNTDFDYIDLVTNGYGRLGNDRTHQVKLSGSYTFPFGLQAGVVSFFTSGRPLSMYGMTPPPCVCPFLNLVPRGSNGEMSWTYSVDFHLEYPLRIDASSVVPVLDVFNLTNVQRATNRIQTYNNDPDADQTPPFTNPGNGYYGKDTAWQSPRLVRVGMRVSF